MSTKKLTISDILFVIGLFLIFIGAGESDAGLPLGLAVFRTLCGLIAMLPFVVKYLVKEVELNEAE